MVTETLPSLAESELLTGLRVVELSSSVGGAYAGRLLASMGATVSRASHGLDDGYLQRRHAAARAVAPRGQERVPAGR